MTFVRTKKIGGKPYAYLVENRWEGGRARQTVTAYLGRVHEPQKTTTATVDLAQQSFKGAVEALINQELASHGFERRENGFVRETIVVNPSDWSVNNKGKPTVIRMNEGFLCPHTLQQLTNYAHDEKDGNGMMLARRLVEAGLNVPKETFVALFEKINKGEQQ